METIHWQDLIIEKYAPIGAADSLDALLHLPSASCERPSIKDFQGRAIVYALLNENVGGGKPWRKDIPPPLREWVVHAQREGPRIQWYLYGGSRGGAWAATLAAYVRLVWSRVIRVAPYVVPRRDAQPMAGGLQILGEILQVAVGDADEWFDFWKIVVMGCAIARTCEIQVLSGRAHGASLTDGEKLWKIRF